MLPVQVHCKMPLIAQDCVICVNSILGNENTITLLCSVSSHNRAALSLSLSLARTKFFVGFQINCVLFNGTSLLKSKSLAANRQMMWLFVDHLKPAYLKWKLVSVGIKVPLKAVVFLCKKVDFCTPVPNICLCNKHGDGACVIGVHRDYCQPLVGSSLELWPAAFIWHSITEL